MSRFHLEEPLLRRCRASHFQRLDNVAHGGRISDLSVRRSRLFGIASVGRTWFSSQETSHSRNHLMRQYPIAGGPAIRKRLTTAQWTTCFGSNSSSSTRSIVSLRAVLRSGLCSLFVS